MNPLNFPISSYIYQEMQTTFLISPANLPNPHPDFDPTFRRAVIVSSMINNMKPEEFNDLVNHVQVTYATTGTQFNSDGINFATFAQQLIDQARDTRQQLDQLKALNEAHQGQRKKYLESIKNMHFTELRSRLQEAEQELSRNRSNLSKARDAMRNLYFGNNKPTTTAIKNSYETKLGQDIKRFKEFGADLEIEIKELTLAYEKEMKELDFGNRMDVEAQAPRNQNSAFSSRTNMPIFVKPSDIRTNAPQLQLNDPRYHSFFDHGSMDQQPQYVQPPRVNNNNGPGNNRFPIFSPSSNQAIHPLLRDRPSNPSVENSQAMVLYSNNGMST